MRFAKRLWSEMKKGATPLEAAPMLGWTTTQAEIHRLLSKWREAGAVEWDTNVMYARLTDAGKKRKEMPR